MLRASCVAGRRSSRCASYPGLTRPPPSAALACRPGSGAGAARQPGHRRDFGRLPGCARGPGCAVHGGGVCRGAAGVPHPGEGRAFLTFHFAALFYVILILNFSRRGPGCCWASSSRREPRCAAWQRASVRALCCLLAFQPARVKACGTVDILLSLWGSASVRASPQALLLFWQPQRRWLTLLAALLRRQRPTPSPLHQPNPQPPPRPPLLHPRRTAQTRGARRRRCCRGAAWMG